MTSMTYILLNGNAPAATSTGVADASKPAKFPYQPQSKVTTGSVVTYPLASPSQEGQPTAVPERASESRRSARTRSA